MTLTLPSSDGSNGQVLGTNGSGVLSFVSTTSSIAGDSDTDISSASGGHILVHDGSDSFDNVAVSGDATLAANGALTISAGAVETGMLADAVTSQNWQMTLSSQTLTMQYSSLSQKALVQMTTIQPYQHQLLLKIM